MSEISLEKKLIISTAAEMLYKTAREYSLVVLKEHPIDRPAWEKAPEDIRWLSYQSIMRFIENPVMTVEQAHAMWGFNMMQQGWRCGEKYDINGKRNPRLKPFAELTRDQKAKSELALSIFRLFKASLVEEPHTSNMFYGPVEIHQYSV